MPNHAPQVEAVRVIVRLARLLERACPELSLPHYRVLAAVSSGEQQATRVATRLALAKPTVSASVDALCRRGLLVREDVTGDQRAIALRLTPSGARLLAQTESAMLARLDDVLARTSDAESATAALAGLTAALDALAGEKLPARLPAGRGEGR